MPSKTIVKKGGLWTAPINTEIRRAVISQQHTVLLDAYTHNLRTLGFQLDFRLINYNFDFIMKNKTLKIIHKIKTFQLKLIIR